MRRASSPLSVQGLTVRFGSVLAVDDVSLDVQPGEVVGLIGPNGAGKTTLIDAVTGFVRPSRGTIVLGDVPIHLHAADRQWLAAVGMRRARLGPAWSASTSA